MDPLDKKKSPFDTESIIQLKWKGETMRMFHNQISAANLASAFKLATPEGLFLRRPDYDLVMFPNDNGTFNVPMDGALYEVQQRIMFAPAEEVDTSVPPIDTNSSNLPISKIKLLNTNNSDISKPDQASQPNITFATMNVDNANDSNSNMTDIINNTNQLLDPIPEEKVPEQKEKPNKLKATANNIEIIEEMQVEPEAALETLVEQKDDVIMDNSINFTALPRIKLVFQTPDANTNNNSNTNTTPNTNKTSKQKKRKIIEEEDDENFTPGGKKKSAKKKRVTYDSDDDDDYTPSKKEAKKKETKKRGRKDDDDEDDDEDRTPNKRMKLNDGSPKKKNMTPRYFFASAENNNVAFSRENGALIANDIKSWVTALEALPEKDMTPALIPEEKTEEKTELKVESSSEVTIAAAAPISPEGKSPKLRKSLSQTKIEKPNHKVDVEKFYECLRPIDWTQQAPEKPIGLKSSLLAYQRRAVAWMIAQERRTRPRLPEERVELDKCTWGTEVVLGGKGILADEMGLGKTIELIALILLNDTFTNDGNLPVRPDDEMRRVKNTLIVAPNILVNQWCSELQKHAPGLVVTVYDGMQTDPEVTKDRIATSHVVVTSYEVLRSEIHYIDDFHMSLRRSSQVYEKPKTPLVNFVWWRVCIDEAQEVKTSTNQAAAMVSKIPAIHRWAVTGTPVKSSFEDIRGLLIFLGLHEYWDRPTKELLPLLGNIMWRHAKAHVQDDITIPGTKINRHTLNLSKFEKFCLEIVVKKQKSIGEDTQNAQNELAKFFSAPFAVVYDLMELKKTKVTDKNKATCLRIMLEESIKETRQKQAQLCDIMNEIGDASFAMFEKDPKRVNMLNLARDSYQSILDLIFENKDSDLFMKVGRIDIGDDSVNVPALLTTCPGATFHALVNLSRVTASRDASKDPQNDDHLERAQMVQLQHLGPIKSDVSRVAEKYKKHRREINAISNNRKNNYRSPWWVRILKFIKNGKSPHFTEKSLIKSLNSGVIQSYNTIFTQDRSDELKLSVTSIDELIERITIGLKEMDEARTNAIKALKGELPVSMKELEAFEKAIDHADDMFTKYEASVATPDNTTATNALDKKDALIQTRKSAKLNETERILLFLEKIVINDSNYYFHLIVPKELSKSSVNPTSTNVRDREVLSILTEDKQVNMSIVLNDEKTEVDKQSLINDMKFVKNIQTVEVKADNNAQKIDFENLDPFQEFHQDSAFKPRMEIDDMPGLENVAEDAANNNNNNNNNNQQQAQAEEEEPVDLTSETFLHYKYYDSYNKKTEASIHYLSLCYHEASAQFKEFEYIKLEVRAGFDLIEALTKYADALKEFESKAERKTFMDSTKEEINTLIQTSINLRAEATTACKKQLEDIAFLVNERKLLQEARPEEAYGSKLARVIDLLEEQLNEDKECKALVFSSWSEPLVQLADLLKTKSIQHTAGQALQGMSAKKTHAERINAFKDNAAIRVMLLSALKQSTGLTLTQANHVVLMDHIEKSSEDQAIGSCENMESTNSTVDQTIELQKILEGDEATILQLRDLLSIRGWCFVEVPPNLQKISIKALEDAEKFFQLNDEEKSKYKLATNFGYVAHKSKQAYRALTGPLLQELDIPEQLKGCVSALSFKLDQMCLQILDKISVPLFGYKLTSDPNNNNLTLKVAGKYSGYGMLDIVEYYNNDDNDLIDKKTLVGSHGDPGLFSISLGSTNPGLSMLDLPTKQWIPIPKDKCVLWCGSEVISMTHYRDNAPAKLQVGMHRVDKSDNGPRRTIWYEVCTKYQIPEAIRFYGMSATPPVVDPQTDPIITVNMKCLMGDVVPLQLRGSDAVYKLKQLMQDKKGFPPEKQRLFFSTKGVVPVDEKTLNDYEIKDGDTVHQILAKISLINETAIFETVSGCSWIS